MSFDDVSGLFGRFTKGKRARLTASMLIAMCCLCACGNGDTAKTTSPRKTVKAVKTLHVYFFEGFDAALGKKTIAQLQDTFDSVAFEGVIPLPDSAYYAPRKRYKAGKLVRHLRHLQPSTSELVVGFSSKDISDSVHNYNDYGVMGWTRPSLHSSVVSTYRLSDKSRLQEDFAKLILHELGHADGLPHCKKSATCYMRDANTKNHFPELTGFCDKCTKHLTSKNWKLPK